MSGGTRYGHGCREWNCGWRFSRDVDVEGKYRSIRMGVGSGIAIGVFRETWRECGHRRDDGIDKCIARSIDSKTSMEAS
jgi:hypothetical protein